MQLSASAPYDCTLLLSSDIGEKAAGLDLPSQMHAVRQLWVVNCLQERQAIFLIRIVRAALVSIRSSG